jgi:hypothetical protein
MNYKDKLYELEKQERKKNDKFFLLLFLAHIPIA